MNEKKSFFSKFVINPFLTISVFILYFFSCFNLITGVFFFFFLCFIFYYYNVLTFFVSLIVFTNVFIIRPFLYYSVYTSDLEKDYILKFIKIHGSYKIIKLFKEVKRKTKVQYYEAESIKTNREISKLKNEYYKKIYEAKKLCNKKKL